jgi:FkbM family methyltransferase
MFIAARRTFYSKWFWTGLYEPATCWFLHNHTPQDAICYDVGANLGYHSLIMARRAVAGRVFAFEPLPELCKVFQQNCAINGITNVHVLQQAIGASTCKVTMEETITVGQARLHPIGGPAERNRELFECNAVALDDFVAEGNPPPSLIKIDVEGAELDVLRGGRKTIGLHQPAILLETHGADLARDVYDFFMLFNYEVFVVADSLQAVTTRDMMPANMNEGHVFARPAVFEK